jgi:hypothetical protein
MVVVAAMKVSSAGYSSSEGINLLGLTVDSVIDTLGTDLVFVATSLGSGFPIWMS